jgi:hypothetical protein
VRQLDLFLQNAFQLGPSVRSGFVRQNTLRLTIYPRGWVCSAKAFATSAGPTIGPSLRLRAWCAHAHLSPVAELGAFPADKRSTRHPEMDYFVSVGLPVVAAGAAFDRRSKPDLRSVVDRLSPTSLFSSSGRVSTRLRRSLPERRSRLNRLSSISMAISPRLNWFRPPQAAHTDWRDQPDRSLRSRASSSANSQFRTQTSDLGNWLPAKRTCGIDRRMQVRRQPKVRR